MKELTEGPLVGFGNGWKPEQRNVEHVPQLDFSDPHTFEASLDNAVVTDDVAAVVLRVRCNGQNWKVTGSSKRNPGDKPDRRVGFALALSRALTKVSRQVTRQAEGWVRHNEGNHD